MTTKKKLTVRAIEEVQPSPKDVILWDTEIPGFGLKVTASGRRSYFLYYRTAEHAQRRPSIGTYPVMRPEQARRIALDMLLQARSGGDPSRDRQAKRAARGQGTVAELFGTYKSVLETKKSGREVIRLFEKDILPVLGKKRAEEVTRADVNRLLDKIADRSQSVAAHVRRVFSAFFTWALPRLPDSAQNPVAKAIKVAPPKPRERVLSDRELEALWQVAGDVDEPWRTALRLLILTGQRRSEVLDADWSEFDLEAALWTIPAERAKNGKAHIVPLAPAVVELLQQHEPTGPVSHPDWPDARWREFDLDAGTWTMPRRRASDGRRQVFPLSAAQVMELRRLQRTGPLFPGANGHVSRVAPAIRRKLDEALGAPVANWKWHDIRRTVATGLQRLGVRLEVTEAVLNHVSGSRAGVVGVYQRYDWLDEKRHALEAWADHLLCAGKRRMTTGRTGASASG